MKNGIPFSMSSPDSVRTSNLSLFDNHTLISSIHCYHLLIDCSCQRQFSSSNIIRDSLRIEDVSISHVSVSRRSICSSLERKSIDSPNARSSDDSVSLTSLNRKCSCRTKSRSYLMNAESSSLIFGCKDKPKTRDQWWTILLFINCWLSCRMFLLWKISWKSVQ